jgi:hypothetical protein
MVGSAFVADSGLGLDAWINEANQKLHGMLVDALGEEYVSSSASFTTIANTSDYAVPASFYKLYGVDLDYHGVMRSLKQYTRAERNTYRELHPEFLPRYSLVGTNIRLYPIPTAGLTGAILYAPEATTLVNSGDTVNYPNGWQRFIVIDAAIQALAKEESDVRTLVAERAAIIKEIEQTKEQRDLATPKRVVDLEVAESFIEDWW